MAETQFMETNALLACMEGDEAEANRLVAEMLPGERKTLATAANLLARLCSARCAVCDDRMFTGDPRGYVHSGPFDADGGQYHHATCPLPESEQWPDGAPQPEADDRG